MKPTIEGTITGQAPVSEYWKGTSIPVIRSESKKPIFHESGYASGHATEVLHVPGLLAEVEKLAGNPANDGHVHFNRGENYQTGYTWAHVQWSDKTSMVFLGHVYDNRPDHYHMSN